MILDTLPVGMLQANCYMLGCERTHEAIVIDPGDEPDAILASLRRHDLKLARILGTHGHFDHLLACRVLQEETGAPFYLHHADLPLVVAMRRTCISWLGYDPGEAPTIDKDLKPGETVEAGDIALEVRLTPGHSPGGVTLVDHASRRAFTGDALFAGSIGRSDLHGGDLDTLLNGIRREILTLPDDYVILSGHGESSTVGAERQTNPHLTGRAW